MRGGPTCAVGGSGRPSRPRRRRPGRAGRRPRRPPPPPPGRARRAASRPRAVRLRRPRGRVPAARGAHHEEPPPGAVCPALRARRACAVCPDPAPAGARAVNAIWRPSGDQAGARAARSRSVRRRAPEPSAAMTRSRPFGEGQPAAVGRPGRRAVAQSGRGERAQRPARRGEDVDAAGSPADRPAHERDLIGHRPRGIAVVGRMERQPPVGRAVGAHRVEVARARRPAGEDERVAAGRPGGPGVARRTRGQLPRSEAVAGHHPEVAAAGRATGGRAGRTRDRGRGPASGATTDPSGRRTTIVGGPEPSAGPSAAISPFAPGNAAEAGVAPAAAASAAAATMIIPRARRAPVAAAATTDHHPAHAPRPSPQRRRRSSPAPAARPSPRRRRRSSRVPAFRADAPYGRASGPWESSPRAQHARRPCDARCASDGRVSYRRRGARTPLRRLAGLPRPRRDPGRRRRGAGDEPASRAAVDVPPGRGVPLRHPGDADVRLRPQADLLREPVRLHLPDLRRAARHAGRRLPVARRRSPASRPTRRRLSRRAGFSR